MKSIAWLDRDGVLVDDPGYLDDPAQLRLLPGAAASLRRLNEAGVFCILVSNQSGIGRGLLNAPRLEEIHRELVRQLAREGAHLDHIEYCPHRPEEGCPCRKPRSGMVDRARASLGLSQLPQPLPQVVIGDKASDLRLARAVGARAVLVRTGDGESELAAGKIPPGLSDHIAADLDGAVDWWLREMARPPQARRILLTRLRFLGDLVLCTPLLDHLRERIPGVELDFLAESNFAPVLRGHPSLDRLWTLPRRAGIDEQLRMATELRARHYDVVVDLFGNPRSVLLSRLARPGMSIGPARGLRSHLHDFRRELPAGDPSVVRALLDLVQPLMGELHPRPTSLPVTDEDRTALAQRLSPDEEIPWLIHAGSTWPDKAWPLDSWKELLGRLDRPVGLLTPPGQAELPANLLPFAPSGSQIVPELPLGAMRALLAASPGLLTHDGGIMHMAIALRRPTLALFGPTDPKIWFPYAGHGPYRVLHSCHPLGLCAEHGIVHASALAHLGVDEVHSALEEIFRS